MPSSRLENDASVRELLQRGMPVIVLLALSQRVQEVPNS
jgi:hypothetical protein